MNLAYDTAARRALAAPAFSHDVFQALGRALQAAWSVLKGLGHARARQQLLQLAREVQASRPELAAQLRRAAAQGWM